MKDKAIFFTVYNRIEYLVPTLEQWRNVRQLDSYDIYFRVEPSDILANVVSHITAFKNEISAEVNIILNESKLGCAKNTWQGFEDLFNKYNFVILTEDDILPSTDVCEYFNYLENKYKEDKSVAVISANYEFPGYREDAVSKIIAFRGQIWGTWKDAWNDYIKETWDFDYSTSENGGPSGWDWNLTLRVFPKNNLSCIVPHTPRSQHIGVHGIHCDDSVFGLTQMASFAKDREFRELVEV